MLNEEETRGSSRGIKTCNLAQIFFFFFDEEETCIARHPPGIYKYRRNELYPIRDPLIVGVFHINFMKFNLSLPKLELGLIIRSTRYNPRSRCLAPSFFYPPFPFISTKQRLFDGASRSKFNPFPLSIPTPNRLTIMIKLFNSQGTRLLSCFSRSPEEEVCRRWPK